MGDRLQERIARNGDHVAADCSCDSPVELSRLYLKAVGACIAHDAEKLLLRAGTRDQPNYPELRNGLVRLLLSGASRGFRIALLGDATRRKAGFGALSMDALQVGIAVEWFEDAGDALDWLQRTRPR